MLRRPPASALALSALLAAGCATPQPPLPLAPPPALPPPPARRTAPAPLVFPTLSSAEVAAAVGCLTPDEKLAQLLIAYPPPGDAAFDQGGVILLGKMLRDPEGLRARVAALRARARRPLLVAVDLEGGDLNRLKALRTMSAFPSARVMGEEGLWEAEAWGRRAGLDLRGLGVNLALGPVLDLADHGFMAETGRSLGTDAVRVARLARAFARGLASAGVLPIGKHYPGYGPVADTRLGTARSSVMVMKPERWARATRSGERMAGRPQ